MAGRTPEPTPEGDTTGRKHRAACDNKPGAPPAHHPAGSTQYMITIHCSNAAAMTRAWKISWNPNVRGQGLGLCHA
jgi:hypothetical protein